MCGGEIRLEKELGSKEVHRRTLQWRIQETKRKIIYKE